MGRNTGRFTTALMLLAMTLRLLVFTILVTATVDTTSAMLMLEAMDTLPDLTVKTRRTSSATSTPRRTLVRSPSKSARRLWPPHTLRSVKKSSPLTVRRLMRRFTTVPMLLVMIPSLLLMNIMAVMVVITSTCILYIRDFEINEKI